MRFLEILFLLMLILVLSLGVYALWLNAPQTEKFYEEFNINISNYDISNQSQFYPNMRYKDRIISYKISESCSESKKAEIESAFSTLDEKTILEFYPSSNGEIQILCSDISPSAKEKNHFIAGEGGPVEVMNTSLYWVIFSGKVSLYRSDKCETPQIAIHEILHTLGFEHRSDPNSILYPVTSCNQRIDDSIIEEINKLYEVDSLPDLSIEKLIAVKRGQYVDFNITIANNGLKDARASTLSISTDRTKIKDIEVEQMSIGMSRMIFIKNLKAGSSAESLIFVVKSEEAELNSENNKARISLIA